MKKQNPRITIITPNFNQAKYLDITIQSVIAQRYDNIQFIVIDGGSTDGSIDVIKKHEKYIDYWVSEADEGSAEAINKGLSKADGAWINWINSDDYLMPGALHSIADLVDNFPNAEWIVGNSLNVDENGSPLQFGMSWMNSSSVLVLRGLEFPQDATFFSKKLIDKFGGRLNPKLKSVFDSELYSRFRTSSLPLLTTAPLSCFRSRFGQISSDKLLQKAEAIYLKRYFDDLPLLVRFARRLLHTRFRFAFELFVVVLVRVMFIRGPHVWPVAILNGNGKRPTESVAAKYLG
jgi:glycosyltransferase involved in cell wall biosynthesis